MEARLNSNRVLNLRSQVLEMLILGVLLWGIYRLTYK